MCQRMRTNFLMLLHKKYSNQTVFADIIMKIHEQDMIIVQ